VVGLAFALEKYMLLIYFLMIKNLALAAGPAVNEPTVVFEIRTPGGAKAQIGLKIDGSDLEADINKISKKNVTVEISYRLGTDTKWGSPIYLGKLNSWLPNYTAEHIFRIIEDQTTGRPGPAGALAQFSDEYLFLTLDGEPVRIPRKIMGDNYWTLNYGRENMPDYIAPHTLVTSDGSKYLYFSTGNPRSPLTVIYSYKSKRLAYTPHSISADLFEVNGELIGIYPDLENPKRTMQIKVDLAKLNSTNDKTDQPVISIADAEKGPKGGSLLYFENGNRVEVTKDAIYFIGPNGDRIVASGHIIRISGSQQKFKAGLEERALDGNLQTRGLIVAADNNVYFLSETGRQIQLPYSPIKNYQDTPETQIESSNISSSPFIINDQTHNLTSDSDFYALNHTYIRELRFGNRVIYFATYGVNTLVPTNNGGIDLFGSTKNFGQSVLIDPNSGAVVVVVHKYIEGNRRISDNTNVNSQFGISSSRAKHISANKDAVLSIGKLHIEEFIDLIPHLFKLGIARTADEFGNRQWTEVSSRNDKFYSTISSENAILVVKIFDIRTGLLLKSISLPTHEAHVPLTSFDGSSFIIELEYKKLVYFNRETKFNLEWTIPKLPSSKVGQLSLLEADNGTYKIKGNSETGSIEVRISWSGELVKTLKLVGGTHLQSVYFRRGFIEANYKDKVVRWNAKDLLYSEACNLIF
jgi:hypothetical protein